MPKVRFSDKPIRKVDFVAKGGEHVKFNVRKDEPKYPPTSTGEKLRCPICDKEHGVEVIGQWARRRRVRTWTCPELGSRLCFWSNKAQDYIKSKLIVGKVVPDDELPTRSEGMRMKRRKSGAERRLAKPKSSVVEPTGLPTDDDSDFLKRLSEIEEGLYD